jgi:hypothetical protein
MGMANRHNARRVSDAAIRAKLQRLLDAGVDIDAIDLSLTVSDLMDMEPPRPDLNAEAAEG